MHLFKLAASIGLLKECSKGHVVLLLMKSVFAERCGNQSQSLGPLANASDRKR